MWQECIERYSKAGDTILDPMAGIGTSLVAALMGRNVICVEKEIHFYEPMKASWEKMKQHPLLGYTLGDVTILQGDARRLEGLVADCIVTSPPFGGVEQHTGGESSTWAKHYGYQQANTGYTRKADVEDSENIGNMKGQKYWDAMRVVYQQCHAVLKDAGTLVLVTKGFTRDGSYVDLPGQTKELVESLGFQMFDEWLRELWSLSFWRILQQRRDPEAFDDRLKFETVQAYRKTGGHGSVDVVLTSPPYEGITGEGKVIGSQGHATGAFSYTRKKVDCVITSPPYEKSITGEPGIDWTKVKGRDMSIEPGNATRIKIHSGYTRKGTDA